MPGATWDHFFCTVEPSPSHTPPAQTQYMQDKILGEFFLRECMRGMYSHSREHRKNVSKNYFPSICQILGGFMSVRIRAVLVFAPVPIVHETFLTNYILYWFRARAYSVSKFVAHILRVFPLVRNPVERDSVSETPK